MRVLLVNDTTAFAGTERHLWDLARGLSGVGVEVSVACPQPSPLSQCMKGSGIAVHPVRTHCVVDFPGSVALGKLIRCEGMDVVHAHNGRTALLAALALALRGGPALVFTQHFLEPSHRRRTGLPGFLHRIAHSWVNLRIDHFIAISKAVEERMAERGDATAKRGTVVPNGIVAPDLTMLKAPSQMRKRLGLEGDQTLILCAARLEPEKNIETLIRAMATVRRLYPRAVCAVIGEGSQRAPLEALAGELDVNETVRLLGFQEDAMSWMRAADLVVLPSVAEPFGLVLLEAMALGKPVIATEAGGPREIVVDGATGLLVPPRNPDAMADAIERLAGDPALRAQMGSAGRERFSTHYTSDRMAAATIAVYERALRESNRAAH